MTDTDDGARDQGAVVVSPFEVINRYVQNRGQTERILFALTEHGYQITQAQAGEQLIQYGDVVGTRTQLERAGTFTSLEDSVMRDRQRAAAPPTDPEEG